MNLYWNKPGFSVHFNDAVWSDFGIVYWSNSSSSSGKTSISYSHWGFTLLFFMYKSCINMCIKSWNVSSSKFSWKMDVLVRRNVGRSYGCHQNSVSSTLFEGIRPANSSRPEFLGGEGFWKFLGKEFCWGISSLVLIFLVSGSSFQHFQMDMKAPSSLHKYQQGDVGIH